jgi:hypothetical protein
MVGFKKRWGFAIFFMVACPLWAQNDKGFVIESIEIDIENQSFWGGNTRDTSLMRVLELRLGQVLASEAELLYYEVQWRDRLSDITLFVGDRTITVTRLNMQDEQGRTKLAVSIKAKEGFNVFPLPSFKFDSNTGLKLGARVRHYNFLGSLHPLSFTIDYSNDEDGVKRVTGKLESSNSFRIAEHWYTLSYGTEATYAQKYDFDDTLFHFHTSFGSGWNFLERDRLYLYFSVSQAVVATGAAAQNANLLDANDPYFFTSGLSGGFSYKVVEVPGFDWLIYQASVGLSGSYRFESSLVDRRRGVNTSFNQNLSMGSVNETPNRLRQGMSLNLLNNNNINSYRASTYGMFGDNRTHANRSGYTTTLGAEARGYMPFFDQFALQGRAGIKYRPFQNERADDEVIDWGDTVRGVRDNKMQGDLGAYWNFEFETRMWWGDFLAKIFQMNATLFYDGGIMHSHAAGGVWAPVQHGFGVEFKIFPTFSRSFQIRLSLGINATDWLGGPPIPINTSRYELYLGTDMHF